MAGPPQLGDDAADERAPAIGRAVVVEREAVALAEVERLGLDRPLGAGGRLDRDAGGDRERQAEAVVVVGVLADQVDAPGPEGADGAHRTWSVVATTIAMMSRTATAIARWAQTRAGGRPPASAPRRRGAAAGPWCAPGPWWAAGPA